VGCRECAAKTTLLRVVAVWVEAQAVLTPDPAGRLPGRGANVHFDPVCIDLAEKRRAFPRALRLAGPLDVTPVRACVAALHRSTEGSTDTSPDESRSTTP
jgi:predicted RNA-binding protein YlxR (DUF448 family)